MLIKNLAETMFFIGTSCLIVVALNLLISEFWSFISLWLELRTERQLEKHGLCFRVGVTSIILSLYLEHFEVIHAKLLPI